MATSDKFCAKCGAKLGAKEMFCHNCGAKVEQAASGKTSDNKSIKGATLPEGRKKSAITGFIFSIIALLSSPLSLFTAPFSLVGLIFSILGIKSSKKKLAIAGTIISSLALIIQLVLAMLIMNYSKTK